MEVRGIVRSGEHERRLEATRQELTARRRRYRFLIGVLAVVLVAGLLDPFTSNRLVDGVKGTAIALTAPVALYFSVRMEQMAR